jgi:hypothetical protein
MDKLETLKKRGHVYLIRVVAIIAFIVIVFETFFKQALSFLSQELILFLMVIAIWLIVEIIDKIPTVLEKELQLYCKLKSNQDETAKDEIQKYFKESEKIQIFGYTGETLKRYLDYELIHNGGKQIFILRRNWRNEETDETSYNQQIAEEIAKGKRKWEKANIIKTGAEALENECRANQRIRLHQKFYSTPPSIKGYIFDNKIAYFGTYEYQKNPAGGSKFKGLDTVYIVCTDETVLGSRIIKALSSQFDRIWESSLDLSEVKK